MSVDVKYKKWLNTVNQDNYSLDNIFDNLLDDKLLYEMCDKHKRLSDKLPIEYRDIYRFSSANEFISYMLDVESDSYKENEIKRNGSKTIFENNDFIVKRILTKEAMDIYGRGSKWCISSINGSSQWDNYIKKNDLFFLVFSKNLPHSSSFKKFVVQITDKGVLYIWDREDIQYYENIFDLINFDKNIFKNEYKQMIIDKLKSEITEPEILNILTTNNAIIAGGVFTSIFGKDKKINDIDIWFSNVDDYSRTIKLMSVFCGVNKPEVDGMFSSRNSNFYESKNSMTYIVNNVKYQFIKPNKYFVGNVNKIVNQFDFTCVMCGVDLGNNEIFFHKNFFNDLKSKRLIINPNLSSKGNLLNRIIKYTKEKQYRISDSERMVALRIFSKLTEEEIVNSSMY